MITKSKIRKTLLSYSSLGVVLIYSAFALGAVACQNELPTRPTEPTSERDIDPPTEEPDPRVVNIDLANWKVTLPIPRADGKPLEVSPPDILDYANNDTIKPYFYNDSTDASLVFYTFPQSSTTNSSYSRTELREQMVPGSNSTNWTFAEGGNMRGTLSVPEVSQDETGDYYRTIIMQIHGRLSNEQRDLIGEDDNNAPPILKIYWVEGKIRVKTKVLKDLNATYEELLHTDAWGDDEGVYFDEVVGTNKFTLEVDVSDGRMVVTLNDNQSFVYDDIHMEKWGVFENYFKAGNYLSSTDEGAYAYVKYYDLEVSH